MRNGLLIIAILFFVNQMQLSFGIKFPKKQGRLSYPSRFTRVFSGKRLHFYKKKKIKIITYRYGKSKKFPYLIPKNLIDSSKNSDYENSDSNDSSSYSETEKYSSSDDCSSYSETEKYSSSGSDTDSCDTTKAVYSSKEMEELNESDYPCDDDKDTDSNDLSEELIEHNQVLLEQKFKQIETELQRQKLQQQWQQKVNDNLSWILYLPKDCGNFYRSIMVSQYFGPHPTIPRFHRNFSKKAHSKK